MNGESEEKRALQIDVCTKKALVGFKRDDETRVASCNDNSGGGGNSNSPENDDASLI